MTGGFEGKVAIVTGAGRGIGEVYAQALADAGCAVAVAELREEIGAASAQRIVDGGGQAMFVHADVGDEASVGAMVDAVTKAYGGVDYLVNNAAIWGDLRPALVDDVTLEEWTRVLTVNVTGVWLTSRAVAPVMAARGGGAIVNQSSVGAYIGGPRTTHYSTSKAAVNGLTRALARDLGDRNIRVNALAPGLVGTEATDRLVSPERRESMLASQCIKRAGEPADLCGALLFLLSDGASHISGQVLIVDGGMTMIG